MVPVTALIINEQQRSDLAPLLLGTPKGKAVVVIVRIAYHIASAEITVAYPSTTVASAEDVWISSQGIP